MRIYRTFAILILIFSGTINLVSANQKHIIQEGILDLTDININTAGSIKLQGDIEFYWNQLLKPENFKSKTNLKPIYGRIPKPWTNYNHDSINLSNKGFGTYRLIIKKNANKKLEVYGLKIYTIFSNYKLWVNGVLLNEVGQVSNSSVHSLPKFKYQDIPIVLDPEKIDTKEIEIIIQVSNFSHTRAGLQRPIFFGTYENLQKATRSKDILNLIIIGLILIIGINHLNMFFFRKKDISNLYFGMVCLVMILRNFSTQDRILTHIFENLNWELLVKFDNFSGFGTIPFFALFFYSLFKDEFPKVIRDILIGIGAFITILVFVTPANFYGKFRLFYEIYIGISGLYITFGVLLVATLKRRPLAFNSFLGMFLLYATAINDILSSMEVIESAYVAAYGLAAFMLIQSLTMTSRSAKAINENENLSNALREEKDNLERTINERLNDLQAKHDELIQHQEKEQEQNWINVGLAEINNVLADNKNDFKSLGSSTITAIVKYIDAKLGILYIVNDNDDEDSYFEMVADYGCSEEIRKNKGKVYTSTGLLGAAYSEKEIMIVNDIPENYLKIVSGLGEANAKSIVIVPLSIDEIVYGMIELAKFDAFTTIEVDFIKKIAQNIANNLNTVRMNEENIELISKFQEQAQLMAEKEEEMDLNMQEMDALLKENEELRSRLSDKS